MRRLALRLNGLFLACVALPTILAIAYFGFIASDVYISESRFVVRSPQRAAPTGLGALLQGTAFSRSQDDTYAVHDFIRSRDSLQELDSRLELRKAYSSPAIDFASRFGGIEIWDTSFEALYKHYLKHVTIEYDTVSSISVLRVRAYSAEQAERTNQQLLEMGERLVNNMNLRSRRDLISVAEQEVVLAEARAKDAAAALSTFRADRSVFDPDRQSSIQLQSVARLREELLAAEAQLAQLKRLAPENPQLSTMQTRVEDLRRSLASETAVVAGRGAGLSAKSPVFDRLVLDKAFAERQLAGSLGALDSARSEAARKQLYLERLVQPNRPDRALEPRRLRAIAAVLLTGLIVWGVLSLIVAGIREHGS